jgi:hypothetical protein
MNRRPEYPKLYDRLLYVVNRLWEDERISQNQLSYAAGFARTEITTLLKRLSEGQNTNVDKWMTLQRLLGVNLEWWLTGEGDHDFAPRAHADEIRRLAAHAKAIDDERKARAAEEGEPRSTRNVLRITKRLKKRAK